MKHLSAPNDPVISKRVRWKLGLALFAGFASAYGLLLTAAVIAKWILE